VRAAVQLEEGEEQEEQEGQEGGDSGGEKGGEEKRMRRRSRPLDAAKDPPACVAAHRRFLIASSVGFRV
jgi:hypothetical protein